MSEQNLEQTLYSKNYTEAKTLITEGFKLSKSLQEHQKAQIFDNLFKEKQYEILHLMAKDNTIETDIYEFDSFDKSIFQSLIRNLGDDEEAIQFLNKFITHFDNLNDEVASKTLLGYFFEKGASIEKIKVLIDAGCDVNFKNNTEENFIHLVIKTNLMKPDLSLAYLELLINEV
ncbi:hypothetical protein ACFSNA_14245 [Pedobacter mendelii]|uniref:hypothetical protein n=1 Tax=Pedobacter mendelii TaxID=1908240 RepID=UPI003615B85E